jgi:nucleotide-binding universal stress UspA family protein
MFKNILVPTDGSALSAKGVRLGVQLAKKLGAKVAGVHVTQPWVPPMYGEAAIYYAADTSMDEYRKATRRQAEKALAALATQAKAAGVRCSTHTVENAQPWEGILKVARAQKCDAISMASHGRGGMSGLILGSETTRVLAHSKIPVLVSR